MNKQEDIALCYYTEGKSIYLKLVNDENQFVMLEYNSGRHPNLPSKCYDEFIIAWNEFFSVNKQYDTRDCKNCYYRFRCYTGNFNWTSKF